MRKLVVAGVAGLFVVAGASVAIAQAWPTVSVSPHVSSTKAGTKAHPKGVSLKTVFTWQKLGSANQPVVNKFVIKFPKGSKWNGAAYTSCALRKISTPAGPSACPKSSIIGSGTGTAYADTVLTHPKITVVNGGAKTIYFYTVLNNPARVARPVIGHITSAGGKYAYTLSTTVPQALQVVAGTPIELTNLSVSVGKASILETTGCSGGSWPYAVTTYYINENLSGGGATGSASTVSSIKCHG